MQSTQRHTCGHPSTLHQMLTTFAILMHLSESISQLISTSRKQLNYRLYPKTRISPHSTISERRQRKKLVHAIHWWLATACCHNKVHNNIWECINSGIDYWNSGIPE